MGFRFACARVVSAVSTWGLKHVFHRPAANFPGKMALYLDPSVIADLAPKLQKGSFCVVGTNGKTTITNLLADTLENAGQRVVCNRTGANLDSGVATALLHADESDWGVFECDELWLAKILPHLKSDYVLLLNLFRDQLDRVGEIDRIQESIANALASSPRTTVIYNADDPLCAAIVERAGNPGIAFGVGEDMNLPQNTTTDAHLCQRCSALLFYDYRQYGQLGSYRCDNCGFARPALDSQAREVRIESDGLSFVAHGPKHEASIRAPFGGAYMLYNVLATYAAADLAGVPATVFQKSVEAFDPQNGRLQEFTVNGCRTLLNLAKNPVGFNQNLKLMLQDGGPKIAAFFVNDKEGDGRDISWLWDIDFDELAAIPNLRVFAGGIRKNDVQVRLKYAGLSAELIDNASDMFARAGSSLRDVRAYIIANYTALPPLREELGRLAARKAEEQQEVLPSSTQTKAHAPQEGNGSEAAAAPQPSEPEKLGLEPALKIVHLFPDLLNLYGDGGNVSVLVRRARDRGIPVEVQHVFHGDTVDLSEADIVFLGGGPDREQRLAAEALKHMKGALHTYVEGGGVLLAICGGFQVLGTTWLLGTELVEGLGIIDMTTKRAAGGSADRLVDNIVLKSTLATLPVIGYENHAGRTYLGEGMEPFGKVISASGKGNNEQDGSDGVLYRNVVGTYLHGPLLSKNPEVADNLLARALMRRAQETKQDVPTLASLDDTVERAAHSYLLRRLGVE